ncbi:MAG: DKNYY domain-containing protein [Bacteroidota bacterium]
MSHAMQKKKLKIGVLSLVVALHILGCDFGSNDYYIPPKTTKISQNYPKDGKVWIKLNHLERTEWFTRIDSLVYCGDISCNVAPMKNVDANSFAVIPNSNYAKDKYNIYYPIEVPCIDYLDCGVCFCHIYVLKGSHLPTFEYLGKFYAKDKNTVFYRGTRLDRADSETFQLIEEGDYFYFAKDKNHVYLHDEIVEELDAASFYYDIQEKNHRSKSIVGDKNGEWEFQAPDKLTKLK